ncbi:MAG: element excision factor XisH family protein [Trueperaceae bacterium]
MEIEMLGRPSPMASLEQALGQCVLYSDTLEILEPERLLFLAVPESAKELLTEPIGQLLLWLKKRKQNHIPNTWHVR